MRWTVLLLAIAAAGCRPSEGSLVADAPLLAAKLRRDLEEDLHHCQEITRKLWRDRDLLPEVAREAVGLLSDWL